MSEFQLYRLTSSVFIAGSLSAEPASFGGAACLCFGVIYFVISLFSSKD